MTVSNFPAGFTATNGPYQIGTRIVVIGHSQPSAGVYRLSAVHTTDPALGWTKVDSATTLGGGVHGRHVNGQNIVSAVVADASTGTMVGRTFNPSTLTWSAQQAVFAPTYASFMQKPMNATYDNTGTVTGSFADIYGYDSGSFCQGGGVVSGANCVYGRGSLEDLLFIDEPLLAGAGNGIVPFRTSTGYYLIGYRAGATTSYPGRNITDVQRNTMTVTFGTNLGDDGCWDSARGLVWFPSTNDSSTILASYGPTGSGAGIPNGAAWNVLGVASGASINYASYFAIRKGSDGKINVLYPKADGFYKKVLPAGTNDFELGWDPEVRVTTDTGIVWANVIDRGGVATVAAISGTTYYDEASSSGTTNVIHVARGATVGGGTHAVYRPDATIPHVARGGAVGGGTHAPYTPSPNATVSHTAGGASAQGGIHEVVRTANPQAVPGGAAAQGGLHDIIAGSVVYRHAAGGALAGGGAQSVIAVQNRDVSVGGGGAAVGGGAHVGGWLPLISIMVQPTRVVQGRVTPGPVSAPEAERLRVLT